MAQGAGFSFNTDTVVGTKVRDLAGYFVDGTVVGSATIVAGKTGYGNALHCTGGALQVPVAALTYPIDTSGGLTVAAWVKLDDNTAAARCIASGTSAGALDWALYASNAAGNVEAVIEGTAYSSTTSIRDGGDHHVMVMVDVTLGAGNHKVQIVVDGTIVLSQTGLTTGLAYSGAATIEAGRNALTQAQPLNGVLDDFRWWNDPVDSASWPSIRNSEQTDLQYAIYGFDDGTGDDLSVYNRDLTVAGSATFVAAPYGNGLKSTSAAAAGSAAAAFGDLDRLSITGWMRLDVAPVGSAAPILAITDTAGTTNKLRVVVNTDLTITTTWQTIYGSFSVTSSSALTVGQWSRFHIAMNPTYVSIRLNSNTQTTTLTGESVPHLSPTVLDLHTVHIGGDNAAGGQVTFDYLNFTRNFVEAPANLYWVGPVNRNPVMPANVARGVWEFNENTGTVANDNSPANNDLTLQTGAGWVTGVQGSALGEGTAAGPAALNNAVAWSAVPQGWAFSGWVKVRASSAGARFLVMRNGSSEVAHSGYLNGRLWVRLYGSSGGNTGIINPTTAPITPETWTHVAASCNGSTVQVFLNGQKVAAADFTVGNLLVPTILRVGGDDGGEGVGDMDSLTLFDTPLSLSNVAWLYANPGVFAAPVSVTISRSTTWKVAAQVTRSRSTSWAVKSRVTASRAATWDVRTAVTKTRAASWDTLAAVTASRAAMWDMLQPVAVSRATGWDVLAGVTVARPTSWRTYALVTATWATSWRTLAAVTIERPTTWAVESAAGTVTITRDASWDTRAAVTATRSTTWTVASLVELTRAATWDALASLTRTRATTWRVLKRVSVTRSTQWSVASDTVPEPGPPGLTVSNAPSSSLSTTNAPSSQLEVSHGV